MTTDAFHAMNMVAELRSRGVRFTETGPETEHLTTVERLVGQRQIEELGGMLTGPEAWPAVVGLETEWLEGTSGAVWTTKVRRSSRMTSPSGSRGFSSSGLKRFSAPWHRRLR